MAQLDTLGDDAEDNYDVGEREIDQALMDLDYFGVFEARAWYGLLKRDLTFGGGKWFKPIPWSINYASVNPAGRERLIRAEIDDLANSECERLLKRDLFQLETIGQHYTGHLIFAPERIKEILANGHHRELARVCQGDAVFLGNAKQMSLSHPDIFPPENSNV